MNWTPRNVAITAGLGLLAVWYIKRQAGAAVEQAAQAVNPVNHDNVFNRGANAVWGAVTDGQGTIGTDIYDWLHGDE